MRWILRWKGRQMEGWIDRNEQIDSWMCVQIYREISRQIDGEVDKQTNLSIYGQVDGYEKGYRKAKLMKLSFSVELGIGAMLYVQIQKTVHFDTPPLGTPAMDGQLDN